MKATGFANGILRQVASKSKYFPKPDKEKKPVDYLALQFAHPKWIVDRWYKRFPYARLESI
jgi:16S rRNA (cytosine967-C5)-methyltransferase